MRRRSGAIHSDSPEEFLQLAQESMEKMGLFYNQCQTQRSSLKSLSISNEKQILKQDKLKEKQNVFSNFNFDSLIEAEHDQEKLMKQIDALKSIKINIVILAPNLLDIYRQIRRALSKKTYSIEDADTQQEIKEDDSSTSLVKHLQFQVFENRSTDLVTRKKQGKGSVEYIFKYWLIEQSIKSQALPQIYLNSAQKIICLSESPFENDNWEKVTQCSPKQLMKTIEELQQVFIQQKKL